MAYILSSQNVRLPQQAASYGARILALLIDGVVLLAAYWLVFFYNGAVDTFLTTLPYGLAFTLYALPLAYPLVMETVFGGQTIGKMVMRIRVVTLEGGGPSLVSLIMRWMLLPVDLVMGFGIGEMCVLFTEKGQRLGDLAAGTWVVRTSTHIRGAEDVLLDNYSLAGEYKPVYPKARELPAGTKRAVADAIDNYFDIFNTVEFMEFCERLEARVGRRRNGDTAQFFLMQVLRDSVA